MLAVAVGLAVLVGLYFPVLHEPYLSDDYQWVFANPSEMLGRAFTSVVSPENRWYRPLQAAVMAAIQTTNGLGTWPIRILALLSHSLFAVLVYRALRELRLSAAGALLGAIFFLISQIAAIVLVGNDMLSQLWSGLFSFITLAALATARSNQPGSRYYLFSLLSYVLALLSKESSSTLMLGVAVIIWYTSASATLARRAWNIVRLGLPYAVILVLFLLWRSHLGALPPHFGGDGIYDFRLGANVIKNIALFGAQSVLPVSSFGVMQAAYERNIIALLLAALLTSLFVALLAIGLVKSGRRKVIVALLLLCIISVTPSIFLNHVSESYLYNALPYLAGLFAIAFEHYLRAGQGLRTAALSIGAFVLLTNGVADYTKSMAIRDQAGRADELLPQVIRVVRSAPDSSTVYLVHPQVHEFEYSVFRYRGFRVIEWAEPFIGRMAARPDVKVRQIDRPMLDSINLSRGIAVTYDERTQLQPVMR